MRDGTSSQLCSLDSKALQQSMTAFVSAVQAKLDGTIKAECWPIYWAAAGTKSSDGATAGFGPATKL